jgi:hypothetical protein
MGSTFQNRTKGTTDREFFQDLMGERYTIVECATVSPRSEGAFYAAVRTNEGPEAGQVWAFVSLVWWTGGYYNFGYKDMDETMGPNAAEAPARVLDALTPLPECAGCRPLRGQYGSCSTCTAREWRADCRVVADNRARAARVKPGQVVRFAKPIQFTSGTELDTLTFEQRDTFRANGLRYRVTGWRTMTGWELVPAQRASCTT